MGAELYIAKKIRRGEAGKDFKRGSLSVSIAVVSIAVSMLVVLVATAVVVGFKNEVSERAVGFSAPVQITDINFSIGQTVQPIAPSASLLDSVASCVGVQDVCRFALTAGVIRTEGEMQGVVIRGSDALNHFFLEKYLKEGKVPQWGSVEARNEIMISNLIAHNNALKVGDRVMVYFVGDPVKMRRLTIAGVYETHFTQGDNVMAFADLRLVQGINEWDSTLVTGVEVQVENFEQLEKMHRDLFYQVADKTDAYGNPFFVSTIRQNNPQLFTWLDVLDTNVWILIVIMIAVSGFAMIASILILILERIRTIGLLKALGASNAFVRRTIVWMAVAFIGRGMLWGNVLAALFCVVQGRWHLLTLDPQYYFINYVPVEPSWVLWVLINVGALVVNALILFIPTQLISKVSPARTMRFE